jgi:hypothetical protein
VDASVSLRHRMSTIVGSSKPGIGIMYGDTRCGCRQRERSQIISFFALFPQMCRNRLMRAAPMSAPGSCPYVPPDRRHARGPGNSGKSVSALMASHWPRLEPPATNAIDCVGPRKHRTADTRHLICGRPTVLEAKRRWRPSLEAVARRQVAFDLAASEPNVVAVELSSVMVTRLPSSLVAIQKRGSQSTASTRISIASRATLNERETTRYPLFDPNHRSFPSPWPLEAGLRKARPVWPASVSRR